MGRKNQQEELFPLQSNDPLHTCGIDEAGRGPLAGPVCAAAVILPPHFPIQILNDSKKLTHFQRQKAETVIKEQALWAIGWASNEEIDRINILQATFLAMERAYQKLATQAEVTLALVDGNRKPPLPCPVITIVKGDAKEPAIMAASILAKEARDRFMDDADKKWPQYGFAIHKGYPTALHQKNLREFGFCPIHRRSFHLHHQSDTNLF
ncbi:MAG: ribonuclease HII [Sphaerochaeta sp.]|jgi:ribonuclease HII|nr:ribonuclease HII [Sphaerochaeta sp.]